MNFKYSLTFLIGLICIGLMVFTVFFSTIHFNPIQNKHNNRQAVFTIIPQGWSFFTRNPREAQAIIYELKDGTLTLVDHRHSSISNLIGLNRRASVIMSEMQVVRAELPDSIFITTKWNYQEGKISKYPEKGIVVKNKIANPILCGEYILVFQKPVPWAWSKSLKTIEMPAKAARIKIECND